MSTAGRRTDLQFEGGCYAKTIRLSAEAEPRSGPPRTASVRCSRTSCKPGTAEPDFDDGRLTENTRSAYPSEFISNASTTGMAGHPKNIVMLAADAFGVLPPIAKLTPSQAQYHVLSGYTAKVAGTEKGLGSEPQATFSTCFGAPFMPRHPSVYGNMLSELVAKHGVDCWLVNTGWTGGKFGVGHRMPIQVTRALLDAASRGRSRATDADRSDFRVPGSDIAAGCGQQDPEPARDVVGPRGLRRAGQRLVEMFNKNFATFESHVDADVKAAAPTLRQAAE